MSDSDSTTSVAYEGITRPRIRHRGSRVKASFNKNKTDLSQRGSDSSQDERARAPDQESEESRWISLTYDQVISPKEAQEIRKTIWKPNGYNIDYSWLAARISYRDAWNVGWRGIECTLRRRDATSRSGGDMIYIYFDGTDCKNFMHLFIFLDDFNEKPDHFMFTSESFLSARYDAQEGTIHIDNLAQCRPKPPWKNGFTLHFIRYKFFLALLLCLWEMRAQITLTELRVRRIKSQLADQKRQEDSKRLRFRSRVLSASPTSTDQYAIFFDEKPDRARRSKALSRPVIKPRPIPLHSRPPLHPSSLPQSFKAKIHQSILKLTSSSQPPAEN